MMLIGWLPSLAHDFEINGVFYNVISTTEVEVTYKGSSHYEYDDEYNGSVVIPSLVEYGGFTYSVTSIGEWALGYCYDLTGIEIPNSVTSIGDRAFWGCTGLTSIEIGNSVTSIGDYAFNECKGLTSVVIGNSVTSIGDGVFSECDSLTSIVVDAGNSKYDSRNGCNAIIETASNTLITGCQNTIIPNSVTSIGVAAFSDCTNLTSIEIPNSVTRIGDYAFSWCSLTNIEIPNSVTSIGYLAFSYCESLTKITCHATTPPTIESYTFTFSNYSADLYVPVGCKAAYEVADYWENFNNIIEVTLDAPVTLNDNDAIVATIGDNIVVKNATVGSVVRVYTADGAMIATGVATDGDIVVEVPAKGIYVVTVGKQTVKVII